VEHVERLNGKITPSVVAEEGKTVRRLEEVKASKARQKLIAVMLMEGASKGLRPLLCDLENDDALGANLYPKNLVNALQVMMVHEAQPVCKLMKKKVTVAEWVEVPEYESMMSKMKMNKMKKGLCFKYGKNRDKAHRPKTKRGLRVKKRNMEMKSNTCRHKNIHFLGSTKALKILDKELMLV
jgi:hypothetical protein